MSRIDDINKYYAAAIDYVSYLTSMEYDLKKIETFQPKGETQFKNIQKLINNTQISTEVYFCKRPPEEILFMVLCELEYLYKDSIDVLEIGNIHNMIRVSNGLNPYEGSYIETTDSKEKYLLFDRVDTLDSIPVVIHEGTHYLQDKFTTLNNGYHNEVLPILMELIEAERLSCSTGDPNIYNKNMSNRLRVIQELINREKQVDAYAKECIGTYLESKCNISHTYTENQLYMYLVSFTYAFALFKKYQNDPEYMLKNIRKIFENYDSVDDLISYYGIKFGESKHLEDLKKEIILIKK